MEEVCRPQGGLCWKKIDHFLLEYLGQPKNFSADSRAYALVFKKQNNVFQIVMMSEKQETVSFSQLIYLFTC